MNRNLWPDFTTVDLGQRSPKRVLLEEGQGIAEKTDGKIEFVVRTANNGGKLVYDCELWVPSIQFGYPFMQVAYQGRDPYPVAVGSDAIPGSPQATNESELVDILKKAFHSPVTQKLVLQLMDAATELVEQ